MLIKRISESKLPTLFGEYTVVVFEEIKNKNNHLALIYGNIINNKKPILSRIHSECLTGDVFSSLRCDCGFQLKKTMKILSKEGRGIIIYHRQEGRNIGLLNKIRSYSLQDKGLDTVEANYQLGFSMDERDFSVCVEILKLFNISTINLLTNNPKKVEFLNNSGIKIIKRIPLNIGRNKKNKNYLDTKKKKMGHLIKDY